VSAGVEVLVLPGDIGEGHADLEDIARDVAHHLDDFIDNRLELFESRNIRDKLKKLLLACADGVSRESVLEDLVAVPGETADDGEGGGLDGDDAADSAVLANGSAGLPGVAINITLGTGQRRRRNILSESADSKDSKKNKSNGLHDLNTHTDKKSTKNNNKREGFTMRHKSEEPP